MKKFVSALLVLAMILATFSVAFAYKEKAYDEWKVVKLKGTAWGYEKVTNNYGKNKTSVALRKGCYAWAVAEKGDWYKIRIPGRNGKDPDFYWFNKKYAKVVSFEDIPENARFNIYSSGGSGRSDESPYFEPEKVASKYKKVTVKSGRRTNVRDKASLSGKVLGVVGKGHSTKTLKLHKDHVAKYDTRGVKFYHVMYKGKGAWVSEQYVTLKK